MSSYTPLFRSMLQGSLCGKFPDLYVWTVMLALADRRGEVDCHPSYIATVAGIDVTLVEQALERLCQPDPRSRTPDHDGRRLAPIPDRGFGWVVLNHGLYAEKARKMARQAQETASGRDAERKRLAREQQRAQQRSPAVSGGVQSCPAVSGGVPLSDSEPDSEVRERDTPPTRSANDLARAGETQNAGEGGREFDHVPLESIAGLAASDREHLDAFLTEYPPSDHTSLKAATERFELLVGMRTVAGSVLVEKAREYAAYTRAKQWPPDRTPGAQTWLRDERWRQDWPIPTAPAAPTRKTKLEQDSERLEQWARDRGLLDNDAAVVRTALD